MAVWTPPEVELAPSLVTDRLIAYLEQEQKPHNLPVLDGMMKAMRHSVQRHLMKPRSDRKGFESATSYTGKCARKARYAYDGSLRPPQQARSVLKFLLGDLVELSAVGLLRLAGFDVDTTCNDGQRDLTITGSDGKLIPVHPDGLLTVGNAVYNLEIKSCDSFTYDGWLANGGPDDKFGYVTQASIECAAWAEAQVEVAGTCFLAVSTGSRQGSVADWLLPFQPKLVEVWHERRRLVHEPDQPPRGYEGEQEREFIRGKTLDPIWQDHGDPQQRLDKNGKVTGYDVLTGRTVLPVACSYCDYKIPCWGVAELDMDKGKPVWVLP